MISASTLPALELQETKRQKKIVYAVAAILNGDKNFNITMYQSRYNTYMVSRFLEAARIHKSNQPNGNIFLTHFELYFYPAPHKILALQQTC